MKNTADTQGQIWEVFTQSKAGQPYRHAGSIHASDKAMALQNARDTYTRRGETNGLWVVRTEDIAATTPDDVPDFFGPNDDKIYRLPSFYTMPEGAKNI